MNRTKGENAPGTKTNAPQSVMFFFKSFKSFKNLYYSWCEQALTQNCYDFLHTQICSCVGSGLKDDSSIQMTCFAFSHLESHSHQSHHYKNFLSMTAPQEQ